MEEFSIFRRTYDEAVDLMVEARDYVLVSDSTRSRKRDRAIEELKESCEAMRVTSRLTQVMAWLMMQRAVQEGEITPDEAVSEKNRLSGFDVCLDLKNAEDLGLPRGLRSLLNRSYRLYVRIARIEEQILDRLHIGEPVGEQRLHVV